MKTGTSGRIKNRPSQVNTKHIDINMNMHDCVYKSHKFFEKYIFKDMYKG